MNRNYFLALALATASILTVGGLAYTVFSAEPPDRSRRAANGCATERSPVSTAAMMVDFTDAPTKANISQLERTARELRQQIPKDGKALIALLDVSAESSLTLVLDVCNPGAKNGDYAERPGPSIQDQRWVHNFYKPFDAALEKAKNSPPSDDGSPILEAVTALSQRADFDGAIKNRKLVVISDGLQLTPKVYSHFKGGDLWKAYLKSGLPAMTQADLTNVDVVFVYLLRPEFAHRQTAAHREFLRRWFIEHGARSFEIRGIRNEEAS